MPSTTIYENIVTMAIEADPTIISRITRLIQNRRPGQVEITKTTTQPVKEDYKVSKKHGLPHRKTPIVHINKEFVQSSRSKREKILTHLRDMEASSLSPTTKYTINVVYGNREEIIKTMALHISNSESIVPSNGNTTPKIKSKQFNRMSDNQSKYSETKSKSNGIQNSRMESNIVQDDIYLYGKTNNSLL